MVSGTCSWTSEATLSLIKSLSTGILADCSCQEFLPFSPPHWYVGFLTPFHWMLFRRGKTLFYPLSKKKERKTKAKD